MKLVVNTDSPHNIGGVMPAIPLPFREDFEIDFESLAGFVRTLVAKPGITGIVVNGVAGEMESLTEAEQVQVVATAVAEADGSVPIIAGIAANTAKLGRRSIDEVMDAGAAAVLVQAPWQFSRGIDKAPEVAVGYFEELGRSGAPVILFQHQATSGRAYSLDLLLRLLEIEAIVAVKETIWDVERYEAEVRAIREHSPRTRVLCANDTLLLASLVTARADGVLVGFGSVVPDLIASLFSAVSRDDLTAAREAADAIWPLGAAIYAAPALRYYPRMKAALAILGMLPRAVVRPPLVPAGEDEKARLRLAIAAAALPVMELSPARSA